MPGLFYPQAHAVISVVFDGFGGSDSQPTIVKVIPREANIHINGYKEADTWDLSFDAKVLPFSPELVRALGVQIYLFDAGGVTTDPVQFLTDENLLVAGLADNATLRYSSSGREFSVDGRDYTALLLDRQWDPKKRLPVGKPLDKWVQELVDDGVGAATHGGRTLVVKWLSDQSKPIVGSAWSKTNKKGKPVKEGTSYWDTIYNTCIQHGFIVFIRGFHVVITTPQHLTTQNASKVKKVAYGRNLSSLVIDRKIGRERVPQIKAVSYDSKAKKVVEAYFPEAKDKVTTGIGTNRDEVHVVTVRNCHSEGLLKKIAENTYNNLARAEAKVNFTTKDLTDLEDADLLQLRAGDPIAIGFDPFNDVEMRKLTTADQRYAFLTSIGYSPAVASLVAAEYDKIAQFKKPFYTKEVNFQWSISEGISIDCEAMNFVSAGRDDVSAGEAKGKAKIKFNDNAPSVNPVTPGRAP